MKKRPGKAYFINLSLLKCCFLCNSILTKKSKIYLIFTQTLTRQFIKVVSQKMLDKNI